MDEDTASLADQETASPRIQNSSGSVLLNYNKEYEEGEEEEDDDEDHNRHSVMSVPQELAFGRAL